MKQQKELNFDTKCIHAGQKPENTTGAVMMPVFQTSTYAQESPGKHKGFEYSRTQNPTRLALEKNLAGLEHAQHGFCFASGCAAASTLMLALNPGDHVLAMDDIYGGTRRLFDKVFRRFGISFSFADLTQEANFSAGVTPKTRLLWIETPSNPLLKIVDIKAICEQARSRNIQVVVDNTFATPALQNPLLLGADLVVHSTTKYIGGHSDVVGGAILTNDDKWADNLAFLSNSIGAIPAPWDCYLLLRGAKTLGARMKQHNENAEFIYQNLKNHKKIERIYYPWAPESEHYGTAIRQMSGPSGMVSFVVKGGLGQAIAICEKTRLFTCAESLGGVESLIEHPSTMTHASISPSDRAAIGIADGLVRLSIGIEDKSDLWNDLEQAIESF